MLVYQMVYGQTGSLPKNPWAPPAPAADPVARPAGVHAANLDFHQAFQETWEKQAAFSKSLNCIQICISNI